MLNGAAVVEWVVALVYTFYVWSFAIDFVPAVRTKKHWGWGNGSRETEVEMGTAMEEEARMRGHPGGVEQKQSAYRGVESINGSVNGAQKPVTTVPV